MATNAIMDKAKAILSTLGEDARAELLVMAKQKLDSNRLADYKPYKKQREFHRAGGDDGIFSRLLIAGNQLGKTWSAGFETAMHLTGQYPEWWDGVRFLKPTSGWAASVTGEGTRDTVQRILLGGAPGSAEWGTGSIPLACIGSFKRAMGTADLIDYVKVKHVSGGWSRLKFKTYEQGQKKWQGETLNFCIAEGQGVQLADGRYLPIEKIQPGMMVRTVNGRGVGVNQKVVAIHDRGIKPVVEVATSRGPWMRMTPDHKVYENTRTKIRVDEAEKIMQLPAWEPIGIIEQHADCFFAWAGLVVAEGSISQKKITMGDCGSVQRALEMLPPGARVRRKDFDEKHNHVPDWYIYWPEFWSLIDPGLAHEKKVPEWVFTASNRQIAVFLSYLFAGDGWASGHNVGYASTSRVLAEHVSVLLARLGIRSSVIRVPSKSINWREQWHVIVCSSRAVVVFAKTVGIPGKEAAMDAVLAEAQRRENSKVTRALHLFKEGVTSERAAASKKQNLGTKDRFSQIRSVVPDGEDHVYDLSIETDHRFVVGTGVVSNCWFDEEPPEEIYTEGKTRTNATGGITYMTFTPLQGMSKVVRRFLQLKEEGSHVTKMTIQDADHYTPEDRARIIASYPAHEREARANGVPTLGSGRIFPIEDAAIKERAFSLPSHFKRIVGMDFGWDHPAAMVWIAYDEEQDVVHIYDAWRARENTPAMQYVTYKAKGDWIPVAWPHDGNQHDKGSGQALANQYSALGFKMHHKHATHKPDKNAEPPQKEGEGGYTVEPGITDLLDRMMTGRLKVAEHLLDWWEEFRLYHREDGKIVKVDDDLMAATRYGVMMLRHAKQPRIERQVYTPGYHPTTAGTGVLG